MAKQCKRHSQGGAPQRSQMLPDRWDARTLPCFRPFGDAVGAARRQKAKGAAARAANVWGPGAVASTFATRQTVESVRHDAQSFCGVVLRANMKSFGRAKASPRPFGVAKRDSFTAPGPHGF
jgi:hypothetical protein